MGEAVNNNPNEELLKKHAEEKAAKRATQNAEKAASDMVDNPEGLTSEAGYSAEGNDEAPNSEEPTPVTEDNTSESGDEKTVPDGDSDSNV